MDIYERLKAGESMDDIAKEFTDMLNQANARVKEEEAAAAKAAMKDKEKLECGRKMMVAYCDFAKLCGYDFIVELYNADDDQLVIKFMNGIEEGMKAALNANELLNKLMAMLEEADKQEKPVTKCAKTASIPTKSPSKSLWDMISHDLF